MDQQQPNQTSGSAMPPAGSRLDQHKLLSTLAYLSILIVVPFLMAKDDPTVKFHIKQGLVLVIIELIVWVLGMSMFGWQIWPLLQLINLGTFVLAIIGIVNVVQGNQKELPLVGGLAKNFNF